MNSNLPVAPHFRAAEYWESQLQSQLIPMRPPLVRKQDPSGRLSHKGGRAMRRTMSTRRQFIKSAPAAGAASAVAGRLMLEDRSAQTQTGTRALAHWTGTGIRRATGHHDTH